MDLLLLFIVRKLVIEYTQSVHYVHNTHIKINQSHTQIGSANWHKTKNNVGNSYTDYIASIENERAIFDTTNLLCKVYFWAFYLNFVWENVTSG